MVGGPLRGYNRALRISAQYSVGFFLSGTALILTAGLLFTPFIGLDAFGTIPALLFTHFWISVVVFLAAIPANMVFIRVFPRRTWRQEGWRARDAGILGVVFIPGGLFLAASLGLEPPDFVQDLLGEWGWIPYVLGWFILFSNLALLVAWAQPSRKG